jgi:hypothetical protein
MVAIKKSGLVSALLALNLAGDASARPTEKQAAVVKRSPLTGGKLRMIPSNKFQPPGFAKKPTDYGLKKTDHWFFGQGDEVPFAMLAGDIVDSKTRFLSSAQFSNSLKNVNCDGDSVDLTFETKDSLDTAKAEWGWLSEEESKDRSIVFVGDEDCGHEDATLYKISSITYDEKALTAKMDGVPTEWKEAFNTYAIHIDSHGIDAESAFGDEFQDKLHSRAVGEGFEGFDMSLIKRLEASKEGSVDINVSLNNQKLFSKQLDNNTEVTISCQTCGLQGKLGFKASIHGSLFPPSLGAGVEFDAEGLAMELGMGLKLVGAISHTETQSLPPISLLGAPLSVGFASIGPQAVVGVSATIGLEASLEIGPIGGKLSFPENPHARVSIGDGENEQSGWNPSFDAFTPDVKGKIQGTSQIAPFVALGLDISAFGQGVSAGLIAEVPRLDMSFKFEATTAGGVCANPNAFAGVSFNAKIGGELNLFGGKEPITKAPEIKVLKLIDIEKPVVDQCFAIEGGEQPQTPPSGPSTIFLEWFKDFDFTGESQNFVAGLDGICNVIAPDFQNSISSYRASQSTTPTGGCLFYTDTGCTAGGYTLGNNQQNQNMAEWGFNDLFNSWKCCEDMNAC